MILVEAAPSEKEIELHSRVADILVRAPDLLTKLQNYKGAGEKIREVSEGRRVKYEIHSFQIANFRPLKTKVVQNIHTS